MRRPPAPQTSSRPRHAPTNPLPFVPFLPLVPLLLLLLLPLSTPTTALQHNPVDPSVLPTGVLSLHIRGFSSATPTGAFTSLLRSVPGAEAAFTNIAEVLEDAVQDSNCFLREGGWAEAVANFYKLRGWEPANGACSSSTTQKIRESRFGAEETYRRLHAAGDFTDQIKFKVMEATVKNFTKVVHPRSFPLRRGARIDQLCSTERTTGLRVLTAPSNPQWYVLNGITNEDITVDLAAWERQYVTEFVGIDLSTRKFVDPLLQSVKAAGVAGERQNRSSFATTLEMWSGRVGSSGIFEMPIEEAPAVILAVEQMDLDVDQARDAVTPSNVAILALPMIINLIPVSLLADVGTFGLLTYTLLTDIVTTVPFIIKGFELIAMGRREYRDHAAWFRGKSSEQFVLAELWATKCRILDVREMGVVFVAVGFAVMLIGVIAEVLARRLRRKWGRHRGGQEKVVMKHVKDALLGVDERASASTSGSREDVLYFDSEDEDAAFAAQEVAAGRKVRDVASKDR